MSGRRLWALSNLWGGSSVASVADIDNLCILTLQLHHVKPLNPGIASHPHLYRALFSALDVFGRAYSQQLIRGHS